MSTNISAVVGNLPCSGESTHAALKGRIVSELMFLSECEPQLYISKVKWSLCFAFSYVCMFSPLLSATNKDSAFNQVTMKNADNV